MKKKSKKKKESVPDHGDKIANDIEYIDKGNADEGSTRRKTSTGRRSLSSLFRRSGGENRTRSESPEKSKSASAITDEHSVGKKDSPSMNPKVNPRRHLGRMTVREALVESKRQGKSPNRSVVKLQKSVLDNQPRDSLSTSLPHILDQFPDPEEVKSMDHTTLKASGHTLPRSTRQSRAERRASKIPAKKNELTLGQEPSENKMLPLDKRKYLIDNNKACASIDVPDSSNIINNYSQSRSAYNSRDISPYNQSYFLDQENNRRESFAKFLQLRETKPASHSSSLSLDKGSAFSLLHEQRTSPFDVVVPERATTTATENISPTWKPHISQPFPVDMDNVSHEFKRKSISKMTEDIPDLYIQNQGTGRRRSSYISPRRFTRNSRSSETENDLLEEDNMTPDVVTATDKEQKITKYHRQFSNSSEKARLLHLKRKEERRPQKTPTEMSKELCRPSNENSTAVGNKKPTVTQLTQPSLSPDETPRYSVKEVQNLIKMLEAQRKVDTCESSTQTDEYVEPVVRPSILPVKTIASSDDIPNIKQENMFVPINDELDDAVVDDVFDTPSDAPLPRNLKSVSEQDVINTEQASNTSDKIDTKNQDDNEDATPSDVIQNEDEKDVTEVSADKETSKSKKGKKKSEKKKKKSKSDDKKQDKKNKHESSKKDSEGKHDDGNAGTAKSKHVSVIEETDHEIDGAKQADEDENASTGKSKKGDRKFSKKKKQLKKTMSVKVPKGSKAREVRSMSKSASFSDIPSADLAHLKSALKSPKGKKSILKKRSRSVEHLSHSDEKLHDRTSLKRGQSIERKGSKKEAKKEIKKDTDANKEGAAKEVKPQAKLSITAIVAIRAKIARMKKAKQLQAQKRAEEAQESENKLNNETNENQEKADDENRDEPEVSTTDEITDRVYFENEINSSIGKQSETDVVQIDENIMSLDKEVKDIVYDKRIHFSSFCDDTMSEEEMIKQRQRNTRLTSRRESKVRQRQKKLISCCKKAIAFLFSHIGLCSLVIGYCIAGGFIFKSLEGQAELAQREKMENLRLNFTDKIYGLAFDTTMEKGSRRVFREQVERILKNYSQTIFKHTKEAGWDGNDNYGNETSEVEQWSFPSSLLYAITVMTTIGYGHVAPKTTHGRITTIAYAVLGIPLTLLCLTNIGDVMAHGFRLLYGKVLCGLCCVLFRPPRRKRIDPEKGLPVDDKMLVHEDEKSEEVIQVPTSVCLLLMSAYILLGTLAFCRWEGWDVITGTYFCFITLSTIGFGDVVPGMSSKNWNKNEKLVLCGLYLLFGLSLIAMCFNLVQEDVKAKAKRLGKRLGIIDK